MAKIETADAIKYGAMAVAAALVVGALQLQVSLNTKALESLDVVKELHRLEMWHVKWESVLQSRAPDYAMDLRTRVDAATIAVEDE